jgi:hypothetical protein
MELLTTLDYNEFINWISFYSATGKAIEWTTILDGSGKDIAYVIAIEK